jgi:hypothetical protein
MTDEIRCREARRGELRAEIAVLAGGGPAQSARRRIGEIGAAAEGARLSLARRALLIRHMEIGDRRPTAWWFSVVDPTGEWFAEAARRAEVYLQDLMAAPVETETGH